VASCTFYEKITRIAGCNRTFGLGHWVLCIFSSEAQYRRTAADASPLPINKTYLLQPTAQGSHPQFGWPSQQCIYSEKTCEEQSLGSSAHACYTVSSSPETKNYDFSTTWKSLVSFGPRTKCSKYRSTEAIECPCNHHSQHRRSRPLAAAIRVHTNISCSSTKA
jgi:hypothetical protein